MHVTSLESTDGNDGGIVQSTDEEFKSSNQPAIPRESGPNSFSLHAAAVPVGQAGCRGKVCVTATGLSGVMQIGCIWHI
jgi:hypothetical protein